MEDVKKEINIKADKWHMRLKQQIRGFINRFKKLQGDPHHVAMGIGIGVFVSITPTIPFHTIIAIALAFILRGSKPAAVIGVWFSNPITIPFFYMGSYKTGLLFFNNSLPFDAKCESIAELMKLGMNTTCIMMTGGIILGILPGIAAYFIARKIVAKFTHRKERNNSDITGNTS